MPYFGQFPNYFQLFLDSLEKNKDVLVVLLITDIDLSKYRIPENLIPISMTFDMVREMASKFLLAEFGVAIPTADCLRSPYKLVDFKILYPKMFQDLIDAHGITSCDYVGWGDCDLIYGRFSKFLDMNEDYDVIGGFHGHLTAFKNTDAFKNLFRAVENLPSILVDEKTHIVDEIAFRKPLLDFLARNHYTMFYINRYFCDIVPSCFYGMFRPDHASLAKNFFDVYNPRKNINYLHYDKDGTLAVVYDDGESRESIYCHLQKRPMSMDSERYESGFYIREHSFQLAL